MDYKISVVIRTYNEEKHIGEVLKSLNKQTYSKFEVIILDSQSTDNTIKIAQNYDVRIEQIEKKEFNYSFASNKCVEYATGEIVCFLSGHSVPKRNNYLELANKVFQDERIGGCYGEVIALPDGSFSEKMFNGLGYIKSRIMMPRIKLEQEIHPGIFSCSNALARRELLRKYPFSEKLGHGGEDVEVAYRIIKSGFYIASVPNLLVMHSHGKKFLQFLQEWKNWREMYENVEEYIKNNP